MLIKGVAISCNCFRIDKLPNFAPEIKKIKTMEPKSEFLALIFLKLQALEARLDKQEYSFGEGLMDNADFIKFMKIDRKTAEKWRKLGRVAYSKVGGKIYYRKSDVEAMLDKHHHHAFCPFKKKLRAA